MNVTNMLKVRKLNDELVKSALFRFGPISRIDIANRLSLTPPTITSNVKELMEQGLVCEAPKETAEKSLGRPKTALDLKADAKYVFGIEAGPYQTPIVLCDLKGRVVDSLLSSHCVRFDDFIRCCAEGVGTLVAKHKIPKEKLLGAGVCIPGVVSPSGEIVRNSYNAWGRAPLRDKLQELTGMPVCVVNNSRSRAIAQELKLKDNERDSFLYYFVKRGVGCPLVCRTQMNGVIFVTSGEAGHMVIDPSGPVCAACGQRGCIDSMASEWALLHACQDALLEGQAPVLAGLCPEPACLTIEMIRQAEKRQDPFVLAEVKKVIDLLAVGLAGITNVTSPDSIYVEAQILNEEYHRKEFEDTFHWHIFEDKDNLIKLVYVEPTATDGAESAAWVALKRLFLMA